MSKAKASMNGVLEGEVVRLLCVGLVCVCPSRTDAVRFLSLTGASDQKYNSSLFISERLIFQH